VKKLIALSATVLVASLATPLAQAEETGGGCGLGALILEGKSGKGAHIGAAILNGAIIPNTTFMTTGGGIMGCDPTQTVSNEQATEVFVASNMDQISTEAAQGTGEYLEVLAQLMGVDDADRPAFKQLAQQNYDQLFGLDSDAKLVIESMQTAMLSDHNLSKYAIN